MPRDDEPADENIGATNARLNDGLKSCRTVLSNYRTLLAGDGDDEQGKSDSPEAAELLELDDH